MLVVVGLVFLGIGARLVDLQALDAGHYARLGLDQRVRTVQLAAERGSIFDRNGNDLAISVPQDTLWADPRVISDPAGYAATIAPMLKLNRTSLEQRLSQRDLAFVYVARKVPPERAKQVLDLHLPGIGTTPESKRFYPSGALGAAVLGSVGLDNQGLYGLEAGYDSTLAGKPGQVVIEQDPRGREIPSAKRRFRPAEAGRDLVLTLDESLQYETEQILMQEATHAQAKHATAVVVDVHTGDVLAMATVDGPNGATAARVATSDEKNRPLTDVYEPGSTNKVITMAGALEDGAVKSDATFAVPDRMRVGDATYNDDESHPTQQMALSDIMRQSSNIGTIEVAKSLGKARFDHYLRAFGFGATTPIKFPGQPSGILLPLADYNATSMGSMPIGQGIAVTEMQMLDAYLTIANGGVSVNPRLVGATVDANGDRHDLPVVRGRRVVSAHTADLVTQMLEAVVTNGTGTAAAIPGYPVAGKTGTARKPPYNLGQHVASFVGFAPAQAPRLAVSVVIDEPKVQIYGGEIAAPAFAAVMQNALRVERVAPDGDVAVPPPNARVTPGGVVTTTTAPRHTTKTTPTTSGHATVTTATSPTTRPVAKPRGTKPGAATSPTTGGITGGSPPTTSTRTRASPTGTLTPAASPSR